MSEEQQPPAAGTLGSVRQLEGALEATSAAREASEARLGEARAEASRLLAAARTDADAAVAERRRVVLAAAKDDTAEIHRRAEERAARVRAHTRDGRAALVEAGLELILPAGENEG
jgi:hypothetical protein